MCRACATTRSSIRYSSSVSGRSQNLRIDGFSGAIVQGAWFENVKDLIISVSGSTVNGLSVAFTTALVVEALYPGRVTGTLNLIVALSQQHQVQAPQGGHVSIPKSPTALFFVEGWDNAVRPDWPNWPGYKLERVQLLPPPTVPQRVAVQPPPKKRLLTPRQERPVAARRNLPQERPPNPGVPSGGMGFGLGFR